MIEQSTADALNKALDLAKQGVVGAFETIKQYAPYVWALARRQVLLEGIENLFGLVVVVGITIFLLRIFLKLSKQDSEWYFGVGIISIVGGFLAVCLFLDGVNLTFNPDYWTMMKILEMVKK